MKLKIGILDNMNNTFRNTYKYSMCISSIQGEVENLEEYSSVMEEKITRFDDVIDRLKSEIFNVEKKEVAKARHKENTLNIFQEEMFRRRM